ncbi:polyglutamine-binding protein 1 [Asbolus verrucosus]|uniref:Polyglutamine-binding protein 1 n=1 Tax=Asbolus verrucosus TaxID=1661398 RepID=A0A482WCX2_ASBVE|nr:polyglutamine-binding protein 1 [Asbolus verrucosus]
MPLPTALAAKLAKRGLLASKKPQDQNKKANYKGWSTCPNKSNIYHECTYWCETHWKGVLTPDPRYMRNMQKLLFKYPLPNNWTEVFDKGLGRYYYWNMENDLVSWLPPRHPKSIKTLSAAKLREKRILSGENESRTDKGSDKDNDNDSDEDERSHHKYSDRRDRDRDSRDDRRHRREDRHGRKRRREDIDPMDPAAYSDIPQGTWSDGLENNKTRADNTASGVLYQQRPYPAPGEVLASNKEKNKKK